MRLAPIQMAATLDTFRTIVTVGNISAMSRPAASDVVVSSPLAAPNRALSSGSRTNARTTRMPRDLLPQHLVHPVDADLHEPELRDHPGDHQADGDEQDGDAHQQQEGQPAILADGQDDATDRRDRRAMRSVQVMKSSICTCCTSLVMRVMSDGAGRTR